jgi:hypothetical protein
LFLSLLVAPQLVTAQQDKDEVKGTAKLSLGKRIYVQTVFVQIIGFYHIQNNAQRTPLQCKTKTILESKYRTTKYI